MFKIKNKMAPNVFTTSINQSSHIYPTRCSNINFNQPTIKNNFTKFCISRRGPYLWNTFLTNENKTLTSLSSFKSTIKKQLFNNTNELKYY